MGTQNTRLTTRTRRRKTITTPAKICSRASSPGGWTGKTWPPASSTASTARRTTTRMSPSCKSEFLHDLHLCTFLYESCLQICHYEHCLRLKMICTNFSISAFLQKFIHFLIFPDQIVRLKNQ